MQRAVISERPGQDLRRCVRMRHADGEFVELVVFAERLVGGHLQHDRLEADLDRRQRDAVLLGEVGEQSRCSGCWVVRILAIDPKAATPMILAVVRVLSQVRIIGVMPAVAKSSPLEISASFIDAAPESRSHSIFGGVMPSALASSSIKPRSLATMSGR